MSDGAKGTGAGAAMGAGDSSSWPAFPPELLRDLVAAGGEGVRMRLLVVGGAAVTVAELVRQTELGLIARTPEGNLTAVPWHAIVRVETMRAAAGGPMGFRAGPDR